MISTSFPATYVLEEKWCPNFTFKLGKISCIDFYPHLHPNKLAC